MVTSNGKAYNSCKPINCDDATAPREDHDAARRSVSGDNVSGEADLSEITVNDDRSPTTSGDSLSNDGAGEVAYSDNAPQADQ